MTVPLQRCCRISWKSSPNTTLLCNSNVKKEEPPTPEGAGDPGRTPGRSTNTQAISLHAT